LVLSFGARPGIGVIRNETDPEVLDELTRAAFSAVTRVVPAVTVILAVDASRYSSDGRVTTVVRWSFTIESVFFM
jgi:hypothetical protein